MGKYYLNHLLCREYGDQFNADLYMSLAYDDMCDFSQASVRNMGLSFKRKGEITKAKKLFEEAAKMGDAISQYEFAQFLDQMDPDYIRSLEDASAGGLIYAKLNAYKFYLGVKQYEKAYEKLEQCVFEILSVGVKLDIPNLLLEVPKGYVIYLLGVNFGGTGEHQSNGSLVNKKTLPDLLYESTLKFEESLATKKDFLYLAATQGHAKSVAKLSIDESKTASSYILNYADINHAVEEWKKNKNKDQFGFLTALISSGSSSMFRKVIDSFLMGENTGFFTRLIDSTEHPHPVFLSFRQMCGESHTNYLIAEELRSCLNKLAQDGCFMAQYQMGWICKEIERDYYSAIKWYSKSSLGFLPALHALGELYQCGVKDFLHDSPCDMDQSLICYTQCAELDYAPSQQALGKISFYERNYGQAIKWFEMSINQNHIKANLWLSEIYKKGDGDIKECVLKLATRLLEREGVPEKTRMWAQEILKCRNVFQELSLQKSPSTILGNKISSEEINSSHDKKIFILTSITYDGPQAVAEAQVSSLMNLVGKNVSAPETKIDSQKHEKEVFVFNEELRSSIHVKEPSLAKASLITLTQAAFLDEKLMSQAEYCTQTGISFATLRDAAQSGTVRILDGRLPPSEEEGILDSALDWIGLSYPSQDILEDFSLFL